MSRLKVVAVLVSCSFTVAVSHSPWYLFPFPFSSSLPCNDYVVMMYPCILFFFSLNTHPLLHFAPLFSLSFSLPSPFSIPLKLLIKQNKSHVE
ncbi:hypothetical protein J3E68DRAFT_20309 [Trichoderma sp. SZMC 28012]